MFVHLSVQSIYRTWWRGSCKSSCSWSTGYQQKGRPLGIACPVAWPHSSTWMWIGRTHKGHPSVLHVSYTAPLQPQNLCPLAQKERLSQGQSWKQSKSRNCRGFSCVLIVNPPATQPENKAETRYRRSRTWFHGYWISLLAGTALDERDRWPWLCSSIRENYSLQQTSPFGHSERVITLWDLGGVFFLLASNQTVYSFFRILIKNIGLPCSPDAYSLCLSTNT